MDPFDLPTPLDVENDLNQIVHNLKRWQALPLHGLRALPSVRSLASSVATRAQAEGEPARRAISAMIRRRIEEATERTVLEGDQEALRSLFTFHDLSRSLTARQKEAAGYRGVEPESFRKKNEAILLCELAGEMYRWELGQALLQNQSLANTAYLDTTPSAAAQ